MAHPKMPCALYTRVSSSNQLSEEYNSLETQKERLEAYCTSQEGLTVYRVYEERAKSGESLQRPALSEMLRDIKLGHVKCVLAYKIDRLTRSVKDFHKLIEIFEHYDVKFISITQSLDTSSPMGRLMRNILLDFAQFEREMIADRTRDKMQQRAQKGLWNGGKPPFGYKVRDKKLVVDSEEAPRVEFMFQFLAKERSLATLREELRRRGWHTRSGKLWSKTSLDNILRNPLYVGKVRFKNELYPGQHKAIVSENLFKNVQSLRRDQRHGASRLKRTYLLKGLLRCGDCGSFMTPHYTQKRRRDGSTHQIPYYRCSKTIHHDKDICGTRSINADYAEDFVLKNLEDLVQKGSFLDGTIEKLNEDLGLRIRPLELELKQKRKRIEEFEAEINRFVSALGKGRLSISRLEKEIEKRTHDREILERQCDHLESRINDAIISDYDAELVRKTLRDFRRSFKSLTAEEQAEALQCVLKKVTLYPDKILLTIYELPEFAQGSQKRTERLPGPVSNCETGQPGSTPRRSRIDI